MNLERFTHKAQDALQKTAKAARAEGHPEVTPEHLAEALLTQEEGVVPALLERVGVAPGLALKDVQKELAKLSTVHGEGAEQREEEMLARDVVVLEFSGDLLGEVDQLHERGREARLRAFAVDGGELRELLLDVLEREARCDADAFEERGNHALFLRQEGLGEVFGSDLWMALRARSLSRLLEGVLGFVGKAFEVHLCQR